jgi:MFS family permease
MSHIGDNLGRKKGEFISWLVCIAGQIMMILSINLYMVGIGSLLLGFGANAAITLHYSFFKELVLGQTRSRMIIAIQLAFSLGISVISLLSYLIAEWKYIIAFFMLIPSLIAIVAFQLVE